MVLPFSDDCALSESGGPLRAEGSRLGYFASLCEFGCISGPMHALSSYNFCGAWVTPTSKGLVSHSLETIVSGAPPSRVPSWPT